MKKQSNRIFLFFLALLMIIGLSGTTMSVSAETENDSSTPVTETTDDTSDDTGTQAFTQTEENIQTVAEPTSKCYVSSARIKEKVDGTEPFDSDDDAGNDSNAKNDIVRSFDSIYYTLEYVTAINTDDPIDKTNLMIEVTLPVDKSVAHFNMDAMKWMQNPQQTEENGVQKLTGYRVLEKGMVPGAGTLSVGIDVKGAANGAEIKPEIKLYLDGNSDEESRTVTDSTIVSAAPRYNIVLNHNSNCNEYHFYDLNSGTISRTNNGTTKGRLLGYGIGLQLLNTSSDKKLKGIEIPQGDITFDITTSHTVNGKDMKDDPFYQTYLWNYDENDDSNNKGYLNRMMKLPEDAWCKSTYPWSMPGNSGGGKQRCYDGGNVSIVEDGIQKNLYHVTVKNYKFNTETWQFPEDGLNNTQKKRFSDNIGFFAIDYLQYLLTFPDTVDEMKNIRFNVSISNFSATSISGVTTNTEQLANDNSTTVLANSYPTGSISTRHLFENSTGSSKATPWSDANSSAYTGETFKIYAGGRYRGDGFIKKFHLLQKYESDAFDTQSSRLMIENTVLSKTSYTQLLYAAKPDKTGWKDNEEMTHTQEENLIYFKDLATLKGKGYVCVGILAEGEGEIYYTGDGPLATILTTVTAKQDQKYSGKVCITCSEFRAWRDTDDISSSKNIEDIPYKGSEYVYGYGDASYRNGTLADDIKGRYRVMYTGYTPAEYKDGQIVGGHHGGLAYGNSLLLLTYSSRIEQHLKNNKTVYDLDKNERTVSYVLTPKTEINQKDITTEGKTNLEVTEILPKGVSYIPDSAYFGKTKLAPIVTENDDGSTKLVWQLENVRIGEVYDDITFDCTIGNVGKPDDVVNNQQLTATATISGDGDKRQQIAEFGNYAQASFSVIKLTAISLAKSTDTPFVNIGEKFNYSIVFSNTSENPMSDAYLYDVLPYNGDNRNSHFGGTYKIQQIVMDYRNAPNAFASYSQDTRPAQYTDSEDVQTSDFSAVKNFGGWQDIGNCTIDSEAKTVTFTNPDKKAMTAFRLATPLGASEYVTVNMTIIPSGTQQEDDAYVNTVYEDSSDQAKEVLSNRAIVQIYGQLKITKAYDDQNNKYHTRPDAVNVDILQNGKLFRTVMFDKSDTYPCTKVAQSIPLYDENGDRYVYTVEESPIPDGYASIVEGDKTSGFTITNKITETKILTYGPDRKELAGSKFQILDEDRNIIEEWTSNGENYVVYGKLVGGKKYFIHQVTAPEGYDVSEDIPFTSSKFGNEQVVTVVSDYDTKSVTVSKKVTGNLGSRDKYFRVHVKIGNSIPDSDISINLDRASATAGGITNPTSCTLDNQGSGEFDFWIRHSEKIIISGIKYGASCEVTEDSGDYAPSVAITENDKAAQLSTNKVLCSPLKNDIKLQFTNTLSTGVPTGNHIGTGVIASVLIGFGLMIMLLYKKKDN